MVADCITPGKAEREGQSGLIEGESEFTEENDGDQLDTAEEDENIGEEGIESDSLENEEKGDEDVDEDS